MKLRILGNSLRLRLNRSEVETIGRMKSVKCSVTFGPGKVFSYCLVVDPAASQVGANLDNETITITLPEKLALNWSQGTEISVYSEQVISSEEKLKILIEKDFFCLKPRSVAEDESELFPNPNAETGLCH